MLELEIDEDFLDTGCKNTTIIFESNFSLLKIVTVKFKVAWNEQCLFGTYSINKPST